MHVQSRMTARASRSLAWMSQAGRGAADPPQFDTIPH